MTNKILPSLNLVCTYCNKLFSVPGLRENGRKQKIFKYCNSLCMRREGRLKKLWVPKWLYNYYLDKKLWHFVVSFKNSKHSIFSSKRQLYGTKNLNLGNFFILWHPNSFLRKKYKWLDRLVSSHQIKKKIKWKKNFQKSKTFHKYIKEWQSKQPKDSQFKIKQALRKSVIGALKRQGVRKTNKTFELLGTDKNTARKHIESLWTEGMSWKNHGLGWDKWHIDHVKPCAKFNLKNLNEQLECCHYKNLQPLWQKDNFKKGSK
tara:strand:+ start:365 stop:1147 length:783 start_codon:yes stop_codon:yes gene_type:complete